MPRVPRFRPLLSWMLLLVALGSGRLSAAETPRTIILGFDGMDHGLAQRFMDEGLLPNLERLAGQGVFQRLETSNPAQSPVSWAVFNTGSNPGKTGVGGFVSRYFRRVDGQPTGTPLPQPMLGFPHSIPADDFVAFPMALRTNSPGLFSGLVAGGAFVVLFVLLKLFGLHLVVALILGLAAGAGGWFLATDYSDSLPADGQLPYEINPMQGTNWWAHLDRAGVRTTGVQVASTYPPEAEGDNTRLLCGLGVKDIGGSPGSWMVFTDDPWVLDNTKTQTAGRIRKIYFDENDGKRATVELPGPRNWLRQAEFETRIAALKARLAESADAGLESELAAVEGEFNTWRRKRETTVEVTFDVDREARTLDITVGDERVRLQPEPGKNWSDFIPVEFPFNERFSAHGVVRFHLIRCDGGDEGEVRVFVPPINIDPYSPPPYLPISSPPVFATDVAEGIGQAYETVGWACMTNPLKDIKDSDFDVQAFLDDIVATMSWREKILAWSLENAADWDVYYQVFSTTDRIGHMLYREFDPGHPRYDAEYAKRTVMGWGRSFPLEDALPEIYQEVDRIVGGVMQRIESGELGDDCLLILVSDHGFQSFRRGVNLNNVLYELGYLALQNGQTLEERLAARRGNDLLGFVDWDKTQAYSMGLGKIFINLEGREPGGIVKPADYDEVVDAIRRDLLALTDGAGGPRVVTSASRRDELFSGPWWKEGTAKRMVRGELQDYEHDGFADIFVGFGPTFRVSWGNTMGGLDDESIVDSTQHWSGDHVSVDPRHVPGILFANRVLGQPTSAGLGDIGPTLLVRYGLNPAQTDMDGKPLPFDGLRP